MYDASNWARSEERPVTWSGANPDSYGWIYVAVNTLDATRCKVGCTRRQLYERTTETTNPFYVVHVAFQVTPNEAPQLEQWIHSQLSRWFVRYRHIVSNRPSEWFLCTPHEAEKVVEECLRLHFECPQDDGGWILEYDPVNWRCFRPHYDPIKLMDRMRDDPAMHMYWKYLFPRLW